MASILLVGVAAVSGGDNLAAAGGSPMILVDSDNDGIDDLLELRIGSNPDEADSDFDGVSDLQELMVGSDFNLASPLHSIPSSDTSLYFNVYSLGNDFVAEIFVLNHSGVNSLSMVRARAADQIEFSFGQLASLLVDTQSFAAFDAGWQIDRIRFQMPVTSFHGSESIAIAAQIVADQALLAQSVTLTCVNNVLAQLVFDELAMTAPTHSNTGFFGLGSGNGNGSGGANSNPRGGLFPTEPSSDGPPASGTLDEVCLQVLQPIAYLGAGRVEYQVADAFCDPLAGAVCLTGCSATLGDTIIGIDIVGLLGG